jgi:hypothetical protein
MQLHQSRKINPAPQHDSDTQIIIVVTKPSILGERNLGSFMSLHHLCQFQIHFLFIFLSQATKKYL